MKYLQSKSEVMVERLKRFLYRGEKKFSALKKIRAQEPRVTFSTSIREFDSLEKHFSSRRGPLVLAFSKRSGALLPD